MPETYDCILVVSFGGPERAEDVLPFLENVLRGKNVPRERMLEVAEHYYHFGGVSPINEQNRQLIAALTAELSTHGPQLPIYWGNRNWHPLLPDTLRQMKADGRRRSLAFFTSAFSSYSGCRQYREDIERARAEVGEGAPVVDKLRAFFNHPGFIDAVACRVQDALAQIPPDLIAETQLVFTAHSIPVAMANGCRYAEQLREASALVAERFTPHAWRLVYQSRSGPPTQPWLEPDIRDELRKMANQGCRSVAVVPIGFVSDHMEILFDLDTEAKDSCQELGVHFVRAASVGTHPRFVSLVRELIVERIEQRPKPCLGRLGPNPDVCPPDCCLSGRPVVAKA